VWKNGLIAMGNQDTHSRFTRQTCSSSVAVEPKSHRWSEPPQRARLQNRQTSPTTTFRFRPLVIICGVIAIKPGARTPLYFIAGVPWGLAEVAYLICGFACKEVKYPRYWLLFVLNFVLLGGTMFLWGWYNDGLAGTGCNGRAWFPGHAVFHILASFSTILTFFSFASERRVE
jgi:hypothetical protein